MEDVSERLRQAWADVQAANLPGHVQGLALVEAVRLRGGGTSSPSVQRTDAVDRDTGRDLPGNDAAPPPTDDASFFAAVERETGIETGELEKVLFLQDGVPHINVPKRLLGSSLKASQVNVGTVIIVARHFGLAETEVPSSAVRDEAQRLGVHDSNIATNLKAIPGIIQAGGRIKVYKVRAAGIDSFKASISALLGKPASE